MAIDSLVTFGCSITKDHYQQTWADLLSQDLGCTLTNNAERGAGASYLVRRLLCTKISRHDVVIIMWPSADRFDLWADSSTPHLQHDRWSASWPDGHAPALVDYHGGYGHDQGFILNGSVPRGYKHKYFKYFYSTNQAVHDWYVNIITAQLYLKSLGVRYIMSSTFALKDPLHYHRGPVDTVKEIWQNIDLGAFVDGSCDQGFYNYCANHDLPFRDSHYPATAAHRVYVDRFLKPKLEQYLS